MLATDEVKKPSGFAGVSRTKKPLQGGKPNTDSAPEAKAENASFDRSCYQGDVSKSLLEGKLR